VADFLETMMECKPPECSALDMDKLTQQAEEFAAKAQQAIVIEDSEGLQGASGGEPEANK
jgi:hypothetical protein